MEMNICPIHGKSCQKRKRKHAELEKKMARAQLPASEAILQQVSEELDTQLPYKSGRFQQELDSRDPIISVIPPSSRT